MAEGEDRLKDLEEKQRVIDEAPFRRLRIDDPRVLDSVEGREICERCYRSRKFFCYTCCVPVIDRKFFPRVKLPIKIDVIKHAREIDGKSTAIHAAILAPDDVTIYTYPDFPIFAKNDRVVLIFPSQTAATVEELIAAPDFREAVAEETKSHGNPRFPVTRAVFIDSTWHQTKAIYKDQKLRDLPCVILKSRISQFWRHQKKSPRWYLATVEAIHEFLVELHESAYGRVEDYALKEIPLDPESPNAYRGQYDNLLYFFRYMYEKIHSIYDHEKLWAYKRPLV